MPGAEGPATNLPFSPRSRYWRMSPRQIAAAVARGEPEAREFSLRYERWRRTSWRRWIRALNRFPERLGVTRDWQEVIDSSAPEDTRRRAAHRVARAMVAAERAAQHMVSPLTEAVLRAGREVTRAQKNVRARVEGQWQNYGDAAPENVVPLVAFRDYLVQRSRAEARKTAREFERAFGPRERRGRPADDPELLSGEIRHAAAAVRSRGHRATLERVAEQLSIGVRTLQYRVKRTGVPWSDLARG